MNLNIGFQISKCTSKLTSVKEMEYLLCSDCIGTVIIATGLMLLITSVEDFFFDSHYITNSFFIMFIKLRFTGFSLLSIKELRKLLILGKLFKISKTLTMKKDNLLVKLSSSILNELVSPQVLKKEQSKKMRKSLLFNS